VTLVRRQRKRGFRWLPGMGVLLVVREREGLLELETRRRVFLAVQRYAGLPLAGLAKEAGLDEDLVRYHVRVLERAGMARTEEEGGMRRVYPLEATPYGTVSPLTPEQRQLLGVLRRPAVLRAVVALLDRGPLAVGELALACGVRPSTASHHLRSMEQAGLVHVESKGRERIVQLRDRDGVLRLLADHPPPRDLVQGFVEAWDDLGL